MFILGHKWVSNLKFENSVKYCVRNYEEYIFKRNFHVLSHEG